MYPSGEECSVQLYFIEEAVWIITNTTRTSDVDGMHLLCNPSLLRLQLVKYLANRLDFVTNLPNNRMSVHNKQTKVVIRWRWKLLYTTLPLLDESGTKLNNELWSIHLSKKQKKRIPFYGFKGLLVYIIYGIIL